MGAQTQGRSDEDLMYETGVYDYPEGFTGPIVSITTIELVTTTGEEVSTTRAIPEQISNAEVSAVNALDDITLAETLMEIRRKLERMQRERTAQEEASRAFINEELDSIQAMIEADMQLAAKLIAKEQDKYSIKVKSRLLMEMIAERKRLFAAQRAANQRSKPPTKTQMRNRICTYLKNIGGYKHNQLKGKSYVEIQKLFDKTNKQVNSFVLMDSDDKDKGSEKKAGGSRKKTLARKRAGEKQSEESSKRQKIEDNAEKEELRAYLNIITKDDVAVNVELLATKYPIVDWKIHVLSEDKIHYEIIRADGSTKNYKIFTAMLDDFDRQDVLELYRLVKERFESTSLKGYDILLWGDLITLFEPIHVLMMDTRVTIHTLVEKKYPLTQDMLSRMLSRRLEVDHENEMAFELLRFTRSQIKK
ncbi:hypothetical protein Tco_0103662 [Tanacetum coccineum]